MTMSPGRIVILALLGLAALVALTVLFYLVFIAPGASQPVDEGAVIFTQAAQTLSVQLTQVAANATGTAGAITPTFTPTITPLQPTFTPRPTNTPLTIASSTPLFTPTPLTTSILPRTATPIAGGGGQTGTPGTPGVFCNAARFVEDVTIPDDTKVNPGTGFIKTWLLENYGYCTWTTGYKLVYVSGDRLSAPSEVPIQEEVKPGEEVEISVNMISPLEPGTYESYWKLSDASGKLFGTGTFAENSIWAIIQVREVEGGQALDFVASACSATWSSDAGTLPCPGKEGDSDGYVIPLSNPSLESRNEDEPGLLTHPQAKDNGYISGIYPPFTVKNGDRFISDIGCLADNEKCNVTFRLEFRNSNGVVKKLGEWNEKFDEFMTAINIDLSDHAGKKIEFILTVSANGSSTEDSAVWFVPHIDRDE